MLLNSKLPFSEDMIYKTQTAGFKSWQDKASIIKPKRIVPRSDGGFVLITEGEYKPPEPSAWFQTILLL